MNNAKFAFWYLLSLVALVFSALGTGMAIFQVINKKVPDLINNYGGYSDEAMKIAISFLIIASPLFYWMTMKIRRALKSKELAAEAAVRRWLTYFILFVSAVVVLVWMILTLNSFLNGELTTKFILKALTVLAIAGTIFSYYFYDIKQGASFKKMIQKIYFGASLVLIVGALVLAFVYVETPKETRNRKQDQNITADLSSIEAGINGYYNSNKKLPAGLNDIVNMTDYYVSEENIKDEVSGKIYEYRVIDAKNYELCADFKLDSKKLSEENRRFFDKRWDHDAGHYCFAKKVEDSNIKGAVPAQLKD